MTTRNLLSTIAAYIWSWTWLMSQRTYLGIILRWPTDTLPAASVLILSSSAFDSVAVRTTCLGLMSSRANGRPDPNIRTSTSSRPDAISLLPSNKKSSLQQSYSTRLFHFNNMHAQQFMYSFMRLGILEGWGGEWGRATTLKT